MVLVFVAIIHNTATLLVASIWSPPQATRRLKALEAANNIS